MQNTNKFTGLADVYTKGRPAYPQELMEYLYREQGFSNQVVVADIGSGTGKFACALLNRGSIVYAVEPNADMRSKAIQELSCYEKFHAVDGTADETILPEKSVDFVTAAQAFHWFDPLAFRKECRRILKEGGKVFLIWNLRDMENEMNQSTYDVIQKYCPDFKGFGGGIQKDDIRILQFFDHDYTYAEFNNPIYYSSKEIFVSRSLSGSYSLKKGDENYQEYLEALGQIYEHYAKDDILIMPNKTVVYFGKINQE